MDIHNITHFPLKKPHAAICCFVWLEVPCHLTLKWANTGRQGLLLASQTSFPVQLIQTHHLAQHKSSLMMTHLA